MSTDDDVYIIKKSRFMRRVDKLSTFFKDIPEDDLILIVKKALETKGILMYDYISYELVYDHFLNRKTLRKYLPRLTPEYYQSLITGRYFRHCYYLRDCFEMIVDDLEQEEHKYEEKEEEEEEKEHEEENMNDID